MAKEKVTSKSSNTKKKMSEEQAAGKAVSGKPAPGPAAVEASTAVKATAEKPKEAAAEKPSEIKPGAVEAAKPKASTPKKVVAGTTTAKKPETTKETMPVKEVPAAGQATPTAKETVAVTITTVIAKVDVGYGNTLYIRGEGGGLSWDEGHPMQNAGSDEWYWSTIAPAEKLTFKFLINDQIWSTGEDLTATRGETVVAKPSF
jgi:hypothetical protein